LKARKRMLEEKLLLEEAAKKYTVPAKRKVGKCLEVGDSILCNLRTEHADIMVECFLGFKTEQLHRRVENVGLGSEENIIIHVGTNC
jgi:hypothetical protein